MDCLILAGGDGTRLSAVHHAKPLVPILGLPLLERVVLAAREAGARRYVVVTREGYRDEVASFVRGLAARRSLDMRVLVSPRVSPENGWSALEARGALTEPFLLLMADHLVSPSTLREFVSGGLAGTDLVLGVDPRTGDTGVDAADATKVRLDGERVLAIGKELEQYDAYDTGLFLCSRAVFDALQESAASGEPSMSAAVRILAAQDRATTRLIDDGYWVDVDTPAQLQRAKRLLLAGLPKPTDGPISRYLNRRLSVPLSSRLARLPIRPTWLSVASFLLAAFGAALFLRPGYPPLLLGGVVAQLASVLDGCDGEVARLKWETTWFGGWLDSVLDRYADALVLFALMYHAHLDRPGWWTLGVGFLALVGSFVNTYSAITFDRIAPRLGRGGASLRIGRDVRLFFVFVAAIADLSFPALFVLAVVMNIEVGRRMWFLRQAEAQLATPEGRVSGRREPA